MKRLLPLLLFLTPTSLLGQSLDPRSYVNTPVGMNFLVVAYAYSSGSVLFDPTIPISNGELTVTGPIVGGARALDLWGLSGKGDVGAGFVCVDGQAESNGVIHTRNVCGMSDPAVHLSVNVVGAPALRLPAFAKYRQDVLVGTSLKVTMPLGQYDPSRLVNIGTNRWSFKPEVGASKAMGRLLLELLASATFYTTNSDLFGGQVQEQAPLFSGQFNAVYTTRTGIWGALGWTLYGGGRVTTNGVPNAERQQNSRLGLTLVFPVSQHNSLKAYASTGVSTRTGSDFDAFGLGWQYRWGGGP